MPKPSHAGSCAAAALIGAALLLPSSAFADSCDQLWRTRNAIFAEAGHCFKSARAVAVFGPRCYPPYGHLTKAQEARVNAISAEESRLGCRGEPSGSDAALPLPPPPETRPGGDDGRLNEAASVWQATKDSNSQAVLEAYISRFGSTAFGDLARARLEEVKKASADAAPPKPRPTPPSDNGTTEMCPKYMPTIGRVVQAPCEH